MRFLNNLYMPLAVFLIWMLFGFPGCLSAPSTASNVAALVATGGFIGWYIVKYGPAIRRKLKKLDF